MNNRPLAITILCIALGVFVLLSFIGGVYAAYESPTLLRIWSLVSSGLFAVSLLGLWRMKRWAVFLVLLQTAINLSIVFVVRAQDTPPGARSWLVLLLPVIYMIVVLPYWKRLAPGTVH